MDGKDSIEKSVQECRKDPGGDLFVPNTAKEAKLVMDQARIHTKVMTTFLSRHCTANCNVNFLFQCNAKCFVPIGAHLNGLTRFPDFVDGFIMLDGMFRDIASTEGKKRSVSTHRSFGRKRHVGSHRARRNPLDLEPSKNFIYVP